MDSALENDMREILRALSTLRVPAAPEEYDIHALVSAALERAGIAARHEARLCPGCRIDFLCGGRTCHQGQAVPCALPADDPAAVQRRR